MMMATDSEKAQERQRRQKRMEHHLLTEEDVDLKRKLKENDMTIVANILACTETVKILNLGQNSSKVDVAAVSMIVGALNSNPDCMLQQLSLSSNTLLGPEAARHLCKLIISSSSQVEQLPLRHIPAERTRLANAMMCSTCSLRIMDLSYCRIGPIGAAHFAAAMCHSSCNLETLNLASNEIGNEGVLCLASALSHKKCKLLDLNLDDNFIMGHAPGCLFDALRHPNCNIHTLSITMNEINDNGFKHLADALMHTGCNLECLHIGLNYMYEEIDEESETPSEGGDHLASALCHPNCKLKELHAHGTHFRCDHADAIADALRYDNRTLMEVELDWYGWTPRLENTDKKIKRLVEINSESKDCTTSEIGKKKRAEFGPTVNEIYSLIRSKPCLMS